MEKVIRARVPGELKDQFDGTCERNGVVASKVIRNLVKKYVEENKEEIKMIDQGFGTVEFKGKEYALTQQAYIDGLADETPIYKSHGIDREGNEYEFEWEVVENWELIEDEQEMVEDWDKPVSVEKI